MKTMIEVFGRNSLKCWKASSLADVNIPLPSKEFLTSNGLPSGVDWTIGFDTEVVGTLGHAAAKGLRILGHDDGTEICLDEHRDGRVVALEPRGNIRFINSSVETFGEFLTIYQSYRMAVRGMSEDKAVLLVDSIETSMRSVDGEAFGDRENWWPVIVEQMRDGNL